MSTLYLARILEAQDSGRIVIECVTIHPDAGLPPASDAAYFVSRLLADARESPDLDPDPSLVISTHRLHTIDIEFTDAFWRHHQSAWWAREPIVADETLRDWLSGPSDNAPYQVAAFEAHIDPFLLPGLTTAPFTSAAYW